MTTPNRRPATAVSAPADRQRAGVIVGLTAAAALAALAALLTAGPAPAQDKAAGDAAQAVTETAIFAGGCFWCTESDFDKVPGVVETISGYAGGKTANPTYRDVTTGNTGHREAVKITYDPTKVSYGTLLDYYWRTVDPTDGDGQFCDRGDSYTTAVFAATPAQMDLVQKARADVAAKLGARIATRVELLAADGFYPAEEYHQDFHEKNPAKYSFYRWNCGRDARLQALWGDAAGKVPEPTPGS